MALYDESSRTQLLDHLRSVIDKIPPSVGYPDWITVLMVLFYRTRGRHDGLLLANEWSSNGSNYKGFEDVKRRWNGFNPSHPRPVGMGTLINLAKKYSRTKFH